LGQKTGRPFGITEMEPDEKKDLREKTVWGRTAGKIFVSKQRRGNPEPVQISFELDRYKEALLGG